MVKAIADYRRSEIVEAAISTLVKHGLSNLSYDLIAEEADTTRQLIRHYYPTSENLMIEVCDYLAGVYHELLGVAITELDQTERLDLFLDFYFGLLDDTRLQKPKDDQYYDALFALACRSEQLKQNLHNQYTSLRNAFTNEVKISYPELQIEACDEIAHLFVSLMYGHWKMVANLGFSEKLNQGARNGVERLIQSYRQHYTNPVDIRFESEGSQ